LPLPPDREKEFAVAQHAAFLEIMARIELHAQIRFRHLRCPHRRADAVAECVALCWAWFVRLAKRGLDGTSYASMLATYAVKQVRSGRRLTGLNTRDAMSPQAQQRHNFIVESLPSSPRASHEHLYGDAHGQRDQDAFEERLRDNTTTPIPDQASFRIDFPRWLHTHSERNQRIANAMMLGLMTKELAQKFGITPGRVSQLRRWFHDDYQRFHGEGSAV